MRKAMVAIGVNRTSSAFPPLRAAAADAAEIARWGEEQGIDCTLLVDVENQQVRAAEVYDAVARIVGTGVYSQLIIYFSGHGVLQAPDCEVWLLSGAPENPNEAINVNGSIARARMCGIEHLVVISDACRSLPASFKVGMLSPGVIFPAGGSRKTRPEVDVFYATLPGDPALEVPPDPTIPSPRGLLTQCLLEALRGGRPTVVEAWNDRGAVRQVVPSRPLRAYLAEAVPQAAAAISISLQQDPDVRVESALPKFLSELADQPSSASLGPGASSQASPSTPGLGAGDVDMTSGLAVAMSRIRRRLFRGPIGFLGYLPLNIPADQLGLRQQMDTIIDATDRPSPTMRTGFVIRGAKVRSALVTGAECDVFGEQDAYQVRVHEDLNALNWEERHVARAALIQFDNGQGVVLAVLSGYVGTVVVVDERVVTVNYTPTPDSRNYDEYGYARDQLEQRRAFIAVAARHGSFRLDTGEAFRQAEYIRVFKRVDPTLGMYAAYAYVQSGNVEGVQSIFRYMKQEPEPVPFDVAMLALQHEDSPVLDFAPWIPMLTQGWTLLGKFDEVMPPILREAKQYLLPSLWSTFSPAGVEILQAALREKA